MTVGDLVKYDITLYKYLQFHSFRILIVGSHRIPYPSFVLQRTTRLIFTNKKIKFYCFYVIKYWFYENKFKTITIDFIYLNEIKLFYLCVKSHFRRFNMKPILK